MFELPLYSTLIGGGVEAAAQGGLTLTIPVHGETSARYTDAQITDYPYAAAHPRSAVQLASAFDPRVAAPFAMRWRAPLRLTLQAQFSAPGDQLVGTAGFGFWNHPFSPEVSRLPRLPRALWFFFGAPPGNLALAAGVSGHGWKAAVLDAARPSAWRLAPLAPLAVLLMQSRAIERRLWPPIQRALAIHERALDSAMMADRHEYAIEWSPGAARFLVDGQEVFHATDAPRGACGFIAWIDNQYAVVTPRGRFGGGLIAPRAPQSLTIRDVKIEGMS